MKKLVLSEGLIACFLLVLLLGVFGKYLIGSETNQEVNARLHHEDTQDMGVLRVYPGEIHGKFSPLSCSSEGEKNVLAMCFSNLLSKDEKGARNNKPVSESWAGEDTDFAHISSKYDEKSKISEVTIQVNPNAATASGKRIDADDLLFNFYLRCDASGTEEVPFGGVHILGQEEYTYGTEDLTKRKKELEKSLKKPSQELKKLLREEIVEKELSQELEWVKGLYEDESYEFVREKYTEPMELFAYYYAYRTKYSAKGKSEQQVFSDILGQYDWDYNRLSKVTGEKYTQKAYRLALSVLLKEKGKDNVSQMKGIQKKDNTTIVVQIKGGDSEVNQLCDMWLLPLEQYGDRASFDGKEHFGYLKGEADAIFQKACQKYSGTGAYYCNQVGEGQIVLQRNPHYFGGAAKTAKVTVLLKEYEKAKEMVEDLLGEKVDIVVAKDSSELEKILANNGTGASYMIRKVGVDTSQPENCFLYRTSYVNAPSLPDGLTEYHTLFQQISQVKVNE